MAENPSEVKTRKQEAAIFPARQWPWTDPVLEPLEVVVLGVLAHVQGQSGTATGQSRRSLGGQCRPLLGSGPAAGRTMGLGDPGTSEIDPEKAHGRLHLFGLAGKLLGRGGHLFRGRCVLLDDLIELLDGLVDLLGP